MNRVDKKDFLYMSKSLRKLASKARDRNFVILANVLIEMARELEETVEKYKGEKIK